MVSLTEQILGRKTEISRAEEQLTESLEQARTTEQQISQQEAQFRKETEIEGLSLKRQSFLSAIFGRGGVSRGAKQIRRAKVTARAETLPRFAEAFGQIAETRKAISQRRQELVSARQQVASVEAQLSAQAKAEQEFRVFQKLGFEGGAGQFDVRTPAQRRAFAGGKRQEEFFKQSLIFADIGKPITQEGKIVGFKIDEAEIPIELLDIKSLQSLEAGGFVSLTKQDQDVRTLQALDIGRGLSSAESVFGGRDIVFAKGSELDVHLPPQDVFSFPGSAVTPRTKIEDVKQFFKEPIQVPLFITPGGSIAVTEIIGALKRDEAVPSFIKEVGGGFEELIGTRGDILKLAPSVAGGLFVGAGIKGVSLLTTTFAPKLVPAVSTTIGIGGIGLGGLFFAERGKQFFATTEVGGKGAVVGATARDIFGFTLGAKLGSRGFTTISDLIRTRGLRELPIVKLGDISFQRRGRDVFFERTPTGQFQQQKFEIIAPEFFKGQSFPKIKPGQTAGQLRQEFFGTSLPGEILNVPRGFTALPVEPLRIIPKGDSFVAGGFSAPKVSPRFLRLGGEEKIKLFSFDLLGGVKPTIVRTQFGDIGFAPGITAKTPRPTGRATKEQIEFFGVPKAERGTSFIPFVKTEKESVLPFGTKVKEAPRKFFIKFGGRRIPIAQVTATAETTTLDLGSKTGTQTLGKFLESVSDRIPESSLFTPEIGGLSFVPSSGAKVPSDFITSGITNFETSFTSPSRTDRRDFDFSFSPSSFPSRRKAPPRQPPSFPSFRPPKQPPGRPPIIPSSPPRPPPDRDFPGFPPFIPTDIRIDLPRPTRERRGVKKRRSDEAKRRQRLKRLSAKVKPLRPSFTGILTSQGIRAKGTGFEFERPAFTTIIGGRDIGILPTRLRGTLTGFSASIKKKGKKKKTANKKRRGLRSFFGFTDI